MNRFIAVLLLAVLFAIGFLEIQIRLFFQAFWFPLLAFLQPKLPVLMQEIGYFSFATAIVFVSCLIIAVYFKLKTRLFFVLFATLLSLSFVVILLFAYKTHFPPPFPRLFKHLVETLLSPFPMLILFLYFRFK